MKSKSQIFRTSFLKSRLIHLVLMHFQTNGWMLYFSVVKSYYLCIKFKQTICCTICIIAAWSDLKEFQTKFQNVLASQYNVTIRIYDCCFVIIIMMMIIIIIWSQKWIFLHKSFNIVVSFLIIRLDILGIQISI